MLRGQNSLVPTAAFHVHRRAAAPAAFATLFVFGKVLEVDQDATRFNTSLTVGRLVWRDDRGDQVLQVLRPDRPGFDEAARGEAHAIDSL